MNGHAPPAVWNSFARSLGPSRCFQVRQISDPEPKTNQSRPSIHQHAHKALESLRIRLTTTKARRPIRRFLTHTKKRRTLTLRTGSCPLTDAEGVGLPRCGRPLRWWRLRRSRLAMAFVASVFVGGCAQSANPPLNDPLAAHKTAEARVASTGQTASDLDCATIRGRMQVAIMHLKSQQSTPDASGLSKGMSRLFGGSAPTSTQAYITKERTRLDRWNAILKQKNCRAFDLEKEFQSD